MTKNPSVTLYQRDLAAAHLNIGFLQRARGRPAEALASLEQSRAMSERLARENSSVTQFWKLLALSQNNIGLVLRETGRQADSVASFERACAIRERLAREHPESPEFASDLGAGLSNLAMIDVDQRQFDKARTKLTQAIEWQRKALAANPNHPTYRRFLANHLNNLIEAIEGLGLGHAPQADQARRELAELRDTDARISGLDARLAAVIIRQDRPKDDVERLQLASRAYEKSLYTSSNRLSAEAFANNPKLAESRRPQHRYNAARAAARAGCGQGKDDPPPDEAAKFKFRRQALDWLKAELAAWAKVLEGGPAEVKATIAPTLEHWTADADLAGIHDEKELAKLSEKERADFRQLWKNVDQLLTKAAQSK